MIRATSNTGDRRSIKHFDTKARAKKELRKLLSKGKTRRIKVKGKYKTIRLTSYRESQSGFGINNPRIAKWRKAKYRK